jgi:hypothetical protein
VAYRLGAAVRIRRLRCDTAKNVELAAWKALKDAALPALAAWKTANPTKKIDDAPFWMTGEVFGTVCRRTRTTPTAGSTRSSTSSSRA